LRRAELVGLRAEDFQIREEHWVIANMIGKGKHIRTAPVPAWVKRAVDAWTVAAEIDAGTIFRRVDRMVKTLGRCDRAEGDLACCEGCCQTGWRQEPSPA
jgi:hypothetical protein